MSGEAAIAPEDQGWFAQMASMALPDSIDAQALSNRLYQKYRIEIPITIETGKPLLRISMQGYNTQNDLDRLIEVLEKELT